MTGRHTEKVRVSMFRWSVLIAFVLGGSQIGFGGDALWAAHVEPLLKQHCIECHSPTRSKSGLDLTSLQAMLRGGDRGASVIPGRPEESNLYKFLNAEADPHMPPGNRKRLNDEEIGLLKKWIEDLSVASPAVINREAGGHEEAGPGSPAKRRITWTPPSPLAPHKAIDGFLERAWKLDKVKPSQRADDATFIRRLYLDLIGRIPDTRETEEFVADRTKDKRSRRIEALLGSDDYARHMREVFDPVLMNRRGPEWEDKRSNQKWFAYLEDAFRRNRPWNEVLRDLIVARPERPDENGAVWFVYERENNAQGIAEAVAPLVFGVQVKCAQCHDHMVAREIKQAHYWGMVAAFNRSKNVDTPGGPGVAESAIGGFTSFANLKKESQPALLTFFNGRKVEELRPKDGEKEMDSPELYLIPPPAEAEAKNEKGEKRRRNRAVKVDTAAVPKFSRRASFADAVTRDNPLLARAMVNRLWAMLFGRGIVHPVDLMDSKHPPSHPELLDWLARDFEKNGHDVKRLIRVLCNTDAYQLDSRPSSKGKPAPPEAFARALDKPLTAEQIYRSLLVATGNETKGSEAEAARAERKLRRAFVAQFPDVFPAEYNATLHQAMFLSNSSLFDELLTRREGNLVDRLAKDNNREAVVKAAYCSVYGRAPDRDELRECTSYLSSHSTESGIKQMLWAMLSSAEFQLNH